MFSYRTTKHLGVNRLVCTFLWSVTRARSLDEFEHLQHEKKCFNISHLRIMEYTTKILDFKIYDISIDAPISVYFRKKPVKKTCEVHS